MLLDTVKQRDQASLVRQRLPVQLEKVISNAQRAYKRRLAYSVFRAWVQVVHHHKAIRSVRRAQTTLPCTRASAADLGT